MHIDIASVLAVEVNNPNFDYMLPSIIKHMQKPFKVHWLLLLLVL